jgi:WD40 repeat protein
MPDTIIPATEGLSPRWSALCEDAVADLRFSPDGTLLAVASWSGRVAVLDAHTGECVARLPRHEGGALALAWSAEGRLLASGGQDGRIFLYDVKQGETRVSPERGEGVSHLVFSSTCGWLAAAVGRRVHFLDPQGTLLRRSEAHAGRITGLAVRRSGEHVWSACDGGVQCFGLMRSEPVRRLERPGALSCLASGGRYLAVGGPGGTAHLWRMDTVTPCPLHWHECRVRGLAFRPDARELAMTGGLDVVLWDVLGRGPAGKTPRVLVGHAAPVFDVAWLPWGSPGRLVSVGQDGVLALWEPSCCLLARAWVETAVPLLRVAASPRAGWLATGAQDGTLTAYRM